MTTFEKRPGQDFVILNLTDLHMIDKDWQENSDMLQHLLRTVDALVEQTKPDLITISGDFTFAGNDYAYHCFIKWLDGYAIPWAPVWGNHDNQDGPEYIDDIADLFLGAKHCIFEKGDPALGNGNYVVRICEAGRPVYALIMMDCHDLATAPDGQLRRDHLWPSQMTWYEQQVQSMPGVKNAIITHVPLYGFHYAFDTAWNSNYDPKTVTLEQSHDPHYWNEGYKNSYGVNHEGVHSCPYDAGEFGTLVRLGATDLVISGHEHVNNFVIDYHGISCVYSLKTGHGAYCDPILNGGTVIRVGDAGRTIEHVYVEQE